MLQEFKERDDIRGPVTQTKIANVHLRRVQLAHPAHGDSVDVRDVQRIAINRQHGQPGERIEHRPEENTAARPEVEQVGRSEAAKDADHLADARQAGRALEVVQTQPGREPLAKQLRRRKLGQVRQPMTDQGRSKLQVVRTGQLCIGQRLAHDNSSTLATWNPHSRLYFGRDMSGPQGRYSCRPQRARKTMRNSLILGLVRILPLLGLAQEKESPPWKSNPSIVKVKRELYRKSPKAGAAALVRVEYVGPKLERLEWHGVEVVDDVWDENQSRWSDDNGRTWS